MTLDRVSGVMDLESERVGFFTDDHHAHAELLAPQIASSVENARLYEELAIRERRMEEDLQAARELQSVLLPTRRSGIRGPGSWPPDCGPRAGSAGTFTTSSNRRIIARCWPSAT